MEYGNRSLSVVHSHANELTAFVRADTASLAYCSVIGALDTRGGARAPVGDSFRPSDWLRAKYSPTIGYHVNILYFDWLP